MVLLTQTFRQSGDPTFSRMLDELRRGVVSHEACQKLVAARRTDLRNGLGIEPTRLFPTNAEVDRENNERLAALLPRHSRWLTSWCSSSSLVSWACWQSFLAALLPRHSHWMKTSLPRV